MQAAGKGDENGPRIIGQRLGKAERDTLMAVAVGPSSSGKSTALLHAINLAASQEWIVVYVPSGS